MARVEIKTTWDKKLEFLRSANDYVSCLKGLRVGQDIILTNSWHLTFRLAFLRHFGYCFARCFFSIMQTSTELLKEISEAIPVAVGVVRRDDGALLYCNAMFGELLGTEAPALVGKSFQDFFRDPSVYANLVAAVERDGSIRHVEVAGRRMDGFPVYALASLTRISFDGSEDALLATLYDVTAQQHLEKELAEMATFPEMNPGPVCRMNREGIVLLANSAAHALFGKERLLGRSWLEVCPGMTHTFWKSALASTAPLPHEADFGKVCVMFSHVHDADAESIFAFGADITDRRKAERQLAEVARFPDMNPGPVIRANLEGIILLANAAAQKVFGESLVGLNWRTICPGINDTAWRHILTAAEVVRLEAHIGECDYVFAHRRDHQGNLVFVFGADVTQQKRTERALHQSEKMATLGTLAAGVAHELNNPAAATRRGAEQLREAFARLEKAHLTLSGVTLPEGGREMLSSLEQRAREHAVRVNSMDALTRSDLEAAVEEWLDNQGIADPWEYSSSLVAMGFENDSLSALNSMFQGNALTAVLGWLSGIFVVYSLVNEIGQGSTRISEIVLALKSYSYLGQAPIQNVNLHEGLDNTLIILRNKLKAGITVTRDYDPNIPPIIAYGSELNQVWTNILDNAADAMGGKGEITIRTRTEGDHALIEIEDNGPGIPESIQSRIFDPFFTTKEPGKGSGLGLSTSYSIIKEKHKGELSVQSRSGFTRFTVKIPMKGPAEGREGGGSVGGGEREIR